MDARISKGITIKGMAKELEVPVNKLSRIENGTEQIESAILLYDISKYLGIEIMEAIMAAAPDLMEKVDERLGNCEDEKLQELCDKYGSLQGFIEAFDMTDEEFWLNVIQMILDYQKNGGWKEGDVIVK